MATFYLDFEAGNDANDGTTFANRWKTITSGATAARIAPGDTIRCMASSDPTLVGNATWNQYSKTVTLAAAVTANIDDGEVAWTASANVTATTSTVQFKEGTKSANLAVAAAFTTGKIAYRALAASTDFSAYQQLSFWIRTTATQTAGNLELRLCSDTIGDTAVDTFAVPALGSTSDWHVFTINKGAALGAAIQSVALYAIGDPGAATINIDAIIACKAASAADSLSLTSLVGKKWNLSWAASTTYAQNDKIKPTQPNRNGFAYKKQDVGAESSGTTEPTWPLEIGLTVADGSVTWVCEELEDSWFGIQSINGVTVLLDNGPNSVGSAGRGYDGATETVATYKREPIYLTASNTVQDSGTDGSLITFSGGWNRTDMSTQTGETWVSGTANYYGLIFNSQLNVDVYNYNAVRFTKPVAANGDFCAAYNCHWGNCTNGVDQGTGDATIDLSACSVRNMANAGISDVVGNIKRTTTSNNLLDGIDENAVGNLDYVVSKNNVGYGLVFNADRRNFHASSITTAGNTVGGIDSAGSVSFYNLTVGEATEFATLLTWHDDYIVSRNHSKTADNHKLVTDGGTIVSATDQRKTASGIAWKFLPTSVNRKSRYPLKLPIAKIAVNASALVTLSIWARRDSTNIKGKLVVLGGQIAGVPDDVSVSAEPTINTWVQTANLTFTPTAAGVVEVQFHCWDGVGTTNALWIDDFDASQA